MTATVDATGESSPSYSYDSRAPKELFLRTWKRTDLLGKPLTGFVVIQDCGGRRVSLDFHGFDEPWGNSQRNADFDPHAGRLTGQIDGELTFHVLGGFDNGRRLLRCRLDGPQPFPEGWDAEESDGDLEVESEERDG